MNNPYIKIHVRTQIQFKTYSLLLSFSLHPCKTILGTKQYSFGKLQNHSTI